MPLAGKMKQNHFFALLGLGALMVAVGVVKCAQSGPSESERRRNYETQEPVTPPPVTPTASTPEALLHTPDAAELPSNSNLSAVEAEVMSWVGKSMNTPKRKDVSTGKPYKINIYQDEGSATINRAKVDIDRDDRWDEKWTFKEGEISRKVSPSDDETYSDFYICDPSGCVKQ